MLSKYAKTQHHKRDDFNIIVVEKKVVEEGPKKSYFQYY